MKTVTCKQLGGPENCEHQFKAESWEDIKQQSMNHGKEMFSKGDEAHLKAGQVIKRKCKVLKICKSGWQIRRTYLIHYLKIIRKW